MQTTPDPLELTAKLVAAYVARNPVPVPGLSGLIQTVHASVAKLRASPRASVTKPSEAEIRASIRPDALISFEDGKAYKALRRHLTLRGLSPEVYRTKWGLPVDYPLVSASYSARRSMISRAIGQSQPPSKRCRIRPFPSVDLARRPVARVRRLGPAYPSSRRVFGSSAFSGDAAGPDPPGCKGSRFRSDPQAGTVAPRGLPHTRWSPRRGLPRMGAIMSAMPIQAAGRGRSAAGVSPRCASDANTHSSRSTSVLPVDPGLRRRRSCGVRHDVASRAANRVS